MSRAALCLAGLLLATACSKKDKEASSERKEQSKAQTKATNSTPGDVVVTLTIDWEGAYLNPEGLAAIKKLRDELDSPPLTHFICPAYFTQEGSDEDWAAQIKAELGPKDEVGLHIHSWFSLAKHAGIEPRREPNFYRDASSLLEFDSGDLGYEIPISAYSDAEIKKLIASAHALLEDKGLGSATSFRSGGYASSLAVLDAIAASGMSVDSSAVWSEWFEEGKGDFQAHVKDTWPTIEEHTQPYATKTPSGTVIQVPNTGAFVEYASSEEMLAHLESALRLSKEQKKTVYVDFGFHQETADEFAYVVGDALINFRQEHPDEVRFQTVTEAAKSAQPRQ